MREKQTAALEAAVCHAAAFSIGYSGGMPPRCVRDYVYTCGHHLRS